MGIPYRPRVRWTDLPAEGDGCRPDILSPKAGQTLELVILNDRVRGVETHFIGERTKPCTGDEESCIGCQQKLSTRWKGYLAVWVSNGTPLAIAELTTEAWRRCPALHQRGISLRGRVLKLSRPGKKPNGRVRADVGDFKRGCEHLPPSFDLECALYRIWFAPANRLRGASHPEGEVEPFQGSDLPA